MYTRYINITGHVALRNLILITTTEVSVFRGGERRNGGEDKENRKRVSKGVNEKRREGLRGRIEIEKWRKERGKTRQTRERRRSHTLANHMH